MCLLNNVSSSINDSTQNFREPYRSIDAVRIHSSLFSYIRNPTELNLNRFTQTLNKINNTQREAINELSINGHSHIHDALHLPFEIHKNDLEQASRISSILFKEIIRTAKRVQAKIKPLLLGEDNAGFTPLLTVLKSGQETNVRLYFKEVR